LKRLEVIHLRLVGQHPEMLLEKIRDSMPPHDSNIAIRLYRHTTVETDVAVHLHMTDPPPNSDLAELGDRIATSLREHGMVEYSVWLEQQAEAEK
jgi:hypothetical protein